MTLKRNIIISLLFCLLLMRSSKGMFEEKQGGGAGSMRQRTQGIERGRGYRTSTDERNFQRSDNQPEDLARIITSDSSQEALQGDRKGYNLKQERILLKKTSSQDETREIFVAFKINQKGILQGRLLALEEVPPLEVNSIAVRNVSLDPRIRSLVPGSEEVIIRLEPPFRGRAVGGGASVVDDGPDPSEFGENSGIIYEEAVREWSKKREA